MLEGKIVKETEKAVLVEVNGEKFMFGKSIIKDNVIPEWAAKQKGLDGAIKLVLANSNSNAKAKKNRNGAKNGNDLKEQLKKSLEKVQGVEAKVKAEAKTEAETKTEAKTETETKPEPKPENVKADEDFAKAVIAQLIQQLPEYKVKLTRGQKGNYGWEITVAGSNRKEVLMELAKIDKALRKMFGKEEGDADA